MFTLFFWIAVWFAFAVFVYILASNPALENRFRARHLHWIWFLGGLGCSGLVVWSLYESYFLKPTQPETSVPMAFLAFVLVWVSPYAAENLQSFLIKQKWWPWN